MKQARRTAAAVTVTALAAALAGCGGGTSAPAAPAAMTLDSSTPTNAMVSVARTNPVLLNFSTAINAATATASNVTLTDAGSNNIAATLAVSGAQVTLTPSQRLNPATQYTVTLGTGLRGTQGQALAATVTRQFTTADTSWLTSQELGASSTGAVASSVPQVAVDGAGNALTVWIQSDGTADRVYASSRATGSTTWSAPVEVSAGVLSSASASRPKLAVNAAGKAVAVWLQNTGTGDRLYAATRAAGATAWSSAAEVAPAFLPSGSANLPSVAIDASGNALALWLQFDGVMSTRVYASRLQAGATTWTTPAEPSAGHLPNTSINNPQLAMNAAGDAIAVWHQDAGIADRSFSARLPAGATTWGSVAEVSLGQNTGFSARYPVVTLDADGHAVAAWTSLNSSFVWRAFAARLSANATVWTALSEPSAGNEPAQNVPQGSTQAVVDASGNVLVAWLQYNSSGVIRYYSARLPAGASTWGTVAEVTASYQTSVNANTGHLAMNASGAAVMVWPQSNGTSTRAIFSRLPVGRTAWIPPSDATQGNQPARNVSTPQVAIDAQGDVTAIWRQGNGTNERIWANIGQ